MNAEEVAVDQDQVLRASWQTSAKQVLEVLLDEIPVLGAINVLHLLFE